VKQEAEKESVWSGVRESRERERERAKSVLKDVWAERRRICRICEDRR